jgi:hypothetical protein
METWMALTALSVVAAVLGLRDLKLLRFRLPNRLWQVPQSWKRFPPSVMAAYYGFGIGLGVLTYIPFSSFYFLLCCCASVGSLSLGVGLMAVYGAARAGTVALAARSQAFVPDPYERLDTVGRLGPVVGYMDGLALALVSGLLLGQASLPVVR